MTILDEWINSRNISDRRKKQIVKRMSGWANFASLLSKLTPSELRFALAYELTRAGTPRLDIAKRIFGRLRVVEGALLWRELTRGVEL